MKRKTNWRNLSIAVKHFLVLSIVLIAIVCAACAITSIVETKAKELIVFMLSVAILTVFKISNF